VRLDNVTIDIEMFREQTKKDRKNDEFIMKQYVKESALQDQLEMLRL
jgi:hypothetical protein